jgi:hypothetical protein
MTFKTFRRCYSRNLDPYIYIYIDTYIHTRNNKLPPAVADHPWGLLPEPYAAIRFPGKGICVLPLGTRRQKGQHATVISSEVLRQSKKSRSSGPQHHKARGPDTAASFLRTVLAQAHSSLAVLRTTCMPGGTCVFARQHVIYSLRPLMLAFLGFKILLTI